MINSILVFIYLMNNFVCDADIQYPTFYKNFPVKVLITYTIHK